MGPAVITPQKIENHLHDEMGIAAMALWRRSVRYKLQAGGVTRAAFVRAAVFAADTLREHNRKRPPRAAQPRAQLPRTAASTSTSAMGSTLWLPLVRSVVVGLYFTSAPFSGKQFTVLHD